MAHSSSLSQALRGYVRIGLLVVLLFSLIGARGNAVSAVPLPPVGGAQITSRPGGLTVQWNIPEPELTTNAEGRLEVRLAGVDNEALAGEPKLPVKTLLVALPPTGTPSLVISNQASRKALLTAPLALEPKDSQSVPPSEADLAPAKLTLPAVFEELGILRGVRLGRLVLRPVALKDGQLEIYSHLQVELNFNAPFKPTPAAGDVLLEQVMARVVNPEQVQSTLLDERAPTAALPELALAATPVMAMQVSQAGLYRVSYDELNTAGFPVDAVDTTKLHITHAGQDVALDWSESDGDAKFEVNEALRFYASPRVQRWSTYDTYFLSVTSTAAPVMASRSVTPSEVTAGLIEAEKTFEQNLEYPFRDPIRGPIDAGRDGDRWIWARIITSSSPVTMDFYFDLQNVDSNQAGTLTVYLNGASDATHTVQFRVNDGATSASTSWTGRTFKQVSVPVSGLKDTGNRLTITLSSATYSEVWLDAFKVRYKEDTTALTGENTFFGEANANRKYTVPLNSAASAALYDVTTPHTPVRLTGFAAPSASTLTFVDPLSGPRAYLAVTAPRAVSNLRISPAVQAEPTGGVDYLMIVHPDFLAGVAPLAAHHRAKGLDVMMENAQAIFDAYGQGLPTPEAIRAYISNAYHNWSRAPLYVLLVGDGTWDPEHYFQDSMPSFIPPYLNLNIMGEYASENRFVTVDGTDLLPDLMLGRLPVNTTAQLDVMVDKIINYENYPPPGDWRRRGTVVADYKLPGDYDFALLSDRLLTQMRLTPLIREKIYYKDTYLTGDATTAAILNAWNEGTALVSFAGHASWHVWGGRYYNETLKNEPLFSYEPTTPTNDDLRLLANGYKLPVVMEFTCETSRFDHPGFDMIDEALVRKQNGGAIAVFGPTSPGYSGSHELLGKGFITGVQSGTATIGQGLLSAKINLLSELPSDFLADTYLVLGDPAVKIQLEVETVNSFYLPLISR